MDDLFDTGPKEDPRKMHCHSIKAYHEEHPKLSKRAAEILKFLKDIQHGMTDRQVKDAMYGQNADMNRVRPRITELIEVGLLVQVNQAKDQLTGKTVRVVEVNRAVQRSN
jgi:repressor of nif and glnA expression